MFKTNFDNFDRERLQITNKFEMDLFKEKGEKALLKSEKFLVNEHS
jgi:hypothetical protein